MPAPEAGSPSSARTPRVQRRREHSRAESPDVSYSRRAALDAIAALGPELWQQEPYMINQVLHERFYKFRLVAENNQFTGVDSIDTVSL